MDENRRSTEEARSNHRDRTEDPHIHSSSSEYQHHRRHTDESYDRKKRRSRSREQSPSRDEHHHHHHRSHRSASRSSSPPTSSSQRQKGSGRDQHEERERHRHSYVGHGQSGRAASGKYEHPPQPPAPVADAARSALMAAARAAAAAAAATTAAGTATITTSTTTVLAEEKGQHAGEVESSTSVTLPRMKFSETSSAASETAIITTTTKSTTSATPSGGGASHTLESSASSTSSSSSSALASLPTWDTHNSLFYGCRSVGCYRPIHAIDEGAYGKVWLAQDRQTGEKVALKQIKFDKIHTNEGFPVTALRETNVLLALHHHPNIIRVREMVLGSSLDKVYMVMDFMPHNLRDFLERLPRGTQFTQAEVKCLLQQLLRGIAFMHDRWFIHRDLKTHNLLIDNEGTLLLCDFGLARPYGSPLKPYTETVVTLWYRAPELLLGSRLYGPAVDMWSVGCIFAEFLTKQPLFQTRNEAETILAQFKLLGTPTESAWPGWKDLPLVRSLRAAERNFPPTNLRKALNLSGGSIIPGVGSGGGGGGGAFVGGGGNAFLTDQGLDLLYGLLTFDPERRLTAQEALNHPWFRENPPPADPRLLPAFPSDHDTMSHSIINAQQGGGKAPDEARLHNGGGVGGRTNIE